MSGSDPSFFEVLESLEKGENILLISPGGTGKSVFLRLIYAIFYARSRGQEEIENIGKSVFITASTGISAWNISGQTLHSWSKMYTGKEKAEYYIFKNMHSKAGKRIRNCTLLLVDEISMIGKTFFRKLDQMIRAIRDKKDIPFGGIQVVFAGDFLQLPPINDDWIFNYEEWNSFKFVPFVLSKCKRYQDSQFYEMLLRIRLGMPTKDDIQTLQLRHKEYLKKNSFFSSSNLEVQPTILYSKKIDVAMYNIKKLEECPSPSFDFSAIDTIHSFDKKKTLSKDLIEGYETNLDNAIPKHITLRVGAQVMLKANLDVETGLTNGSRGVVVEIQPSCDSVKVKFTDGKCHYIGPYIWDCTNIEEGIRASRKQIPLILAWSLTIHKTQSCTIDSVICSLGFDIFAEGQAYVALSRVRKLDGLYLSSFEKRSIKANKEAIKFCEELKKIQETRDEIAYEIQDEKGNNLTEDEAISSYLKKYGISL